VLNTSNTQPVKAAIYNLKGQLVSNLYSGILSTGEHNFVWHGTDMNGKGVANGVYLLRVTGKHELKQRKLSLMK
jgi:flagellar hook assembly protein FlgD